MHEKNSIINHSLPMLTDLYQITMAQGYWKLGKHHQRAAFDLFFREHPFEGGYTVFCGLETVLDMIKSFQFTKEEVDYLATVRGPEGSTLFENDFLQALLNLRLTVDIDAVREGNLVFPREPLIHVEGPLWECQLLETTLLNLINFPTLIATKAARVCYAAKGDVVIEFGLRRAQGPNGGLTASRAAYVGGASSTSNVLAGYHYGIPISGTHAHSWVMAFQDEITAFKAYAKTMPNNCILLVDTYQTLEGVRHAIEIGLALKKEGHALYGIRLDSGDLAALSIEARKLLDNAGLIETKIVASGDLDEYRITELKNADAKISIWGVGTRLTTAYEQPALGGVYKLVAIQDDQDQNYQHDDDQNKNQNSNLKHGKWIYKAKKTDDIKKQSMAGIHQIRRFYQNNKMQRDLIYDRLKEDASNSVLNKNSNKSSNVNFEDLLIPVVRNGKVIAETIPLEDIRTFTQTQLQKLPEEFKVLKPNTQYKVVIPSPPWGRGLG